jgi:hypothetical protein
MSTLLRGVARGHGVFRFHEPQIIPSMEVLPSVQVLPPCKSFVDTNPSPVQVLPRCKAFQTANPSGCREAQVSASALACIRHVPCFDSVQRGSFLVSSRVSNPLPGLIRQNIHFRSSIGCPGFS